jgi:hypothetical protein
MTLSEREKFIQHYCTLSTIRIILRKWKKQNKIQIVDEAEGLKKDVEAIRETRCRRLTEENVVGILDDLIEEAMLGGYVINDLLEDN